MECPPPTSLSAPLVSATESNEIDRDKIQGNILEIYWKYTGNILEIYWKYTGNILEIYWKYTGTQLGKYYIYSKHILYHIQTFMHKYVTHVHT